MNGNVPNWEAETAVVDASTTVKGVVEAATSAEVTAGTATGGTGAVLAVTPNALAASTPVFNGSGLTNVISSSNGTTTKNAADASGTQTIAHGLSKTPKTVEIFCTLSWVTVTIVGSGREVNLYANAFYNGTTQSSQSFYAVSNNVAQGSTFTLNKANASDTTVGVITVDSTNISIAWTKTGSPTGTYNILWRAVA
jgi:NAD(P)H-hydrate repair Nnr-like enzyme with NAD(P)H-hydrate dehydratase domain